MLALSGLSGLSAIDGSDAPSVNSFLLLADGSSYLLQSDSASKIII